MKQKPKILVVGSGIIGASIALSCINLGADVVVLEQNKLGGAASSTSFGWINASFAESSAYFDLRNAAVNEFRNLKNGLDLNDSVSWQGTLWWEDSGQELKKQFNNLLTRGYSAKLLNKNEIKTQVIYLYVCYRPGLEDCSSRPGIVSRSLSRGFGGILSLYRLNTKAFCLRESHLGKKERKKSTHNPSPSLSLSSMSMVR